MKGFRKQYLECKDSGNLQTIDNIKGEFPPQINVCMHYGAVCQSKLCREERLHMSNLLNLISNKLKKDNKLSPILPQPREYPE